MIYKDAGLARAVAENPQTAPIPELHKAMFRFAELFVKRSWLASREDLGDMRTAGANDADLANWLQIASIQTWFTHSADAGGIPMDGDAISGPVMSREREFYHVQPEAEISPSGSSDTSTDTGWLEAPCADERFHAARSWAVGHFGFVPNLFRAVSACPDYYLRHQLGLKLLEKPHSRSISTSLHALVRASVISLDNASYFEPTALALLRRETTDQPDLDVLRVGQNEYIEGTAQDIQHQVVLRFVRKMVKSAYKITAEDAQSFRDVALNDEAYVDVFNTVAIQQSLDRLANCLGVAADNEPLLEKSCS